MGNCCSRDDSSSASFRRQPDAFDNPINNSTTSSTHNSEIDVTSLTENAKKILQNQMIATLIFDENQTVSQVLGSRILDEEIFSPANLVQSQVVANEEDVNIHNDELYTLLDAIKAYPAIKFCEQDFAGSASLAKLQPQHVRLVRDINHHPNMRNFVYGRDLAAKLNSRHITTVYEWYNSPKVHRRFDDKQLTLIDDSCDILYRKAKEVDAATKQLQKVINTHFLIPGESNRHTWPFGFGVLARSDAFSRLNAAVTQYNAGGSKEDLSIPLLKGMTRQGKTRLGDELGHHKKFYGQLNGGLANETNTFIFNLTLNSNWPVTTDNSPIPQCAIESMKHRADRILKVANMKGKNSYKQPSDEQLEQLVFSERELCRRVVAAAVGIFTSKEYDLPENCEKNVICESFLDAYSCNLREITKVVCAEVAAMRKVERSNFVFVFDEITVLETLLQYNESLKVVLYSIISSLIGHRCIVVLSGFSEAKEAISASDRRLEIITLSPISSVILRRELHTMKTKYFSFCASSTFRSGTLERDAIFYYELVKSAPGLLGTVLEYRRYRSESLEDIIQKFIPIICNLKQRDADGSLADAMLKILQLKSLLHVSPLRRGDDKVTFSDNCGAIVFNTIQSTLKQKLVDASASKPTIGAAIEDLYHSRLEPLLLYFALGDSAEKCVGLKDYWDKLRKFSRIAANFNTERQGGKTVALVAEDDRACVFANFCDIDKPRIDTALETLERNFKQRAVNRCEQGNDYDKNNDDDNEDNEDNNDGNSESNNIHQTNNSSNSNIRKVTKIQFATMTGFFFEDAIATGLLLQRQLRRQLMDRSINEEENDFSNNKSNLETKRLQQQQKSFRDLERDPSTSLHQYLDGSEVVCRIYGDQTRTKNGQPLRGKLGKTLPDGRILWSPSSSSSSLSSSSAVNIIDFEGHFPCQPSREEKVLPLSMPAQHRKKPNDVTKEQCDSLDHVLRPRRIDSDGKPENNPLVDVIINERFTDSEPVNTNSGELIQFWIDGKHRQDFRDVFSLNYGNLCLGLEAIADRIKKDGSSIRHILHIIISPFQQQSDKHKDNVQKLESDIDNNLSLPAPLKSYTLCFVTPDDLTERKAFENLVSQPIALSVPLIEEQMTESWTHRLPPPSRWWNYNATNACRSRVSLRLPIRTRRKLGDKEKLFHKWCPVSSQETTSEEFTQWRAIRFNGDCAIGIGHLFGTEKEAREKLSFGGTIKDQPQRSMEIPFGCILEALGILPPRAHGTSYCQYDKQEFRFKLRLLSSNTSRSSSSSASAAASLQEPAASSLPPLVRSPAPPSTLFEISIIGQQSVEQKPPFDSVTVDSEWLLDQIRVGHILRFDHSLTKEQMKVDYEECNGMSQLWKKKFEEYRGLAWRMSERVEKEWISLLGPEKQMTTMTCSDLWNMSLREFKKVLMVNSKDENNNLETRRSKSVQNNDNDDNAETAPLKMTQQDCDDIVSAFLTCDEESRKRAVANLCNYIKVCDFKLNK